MEIKGEKDKMLEESKKFCEEIVSLKLKLEEQNKIYDDITTELTTRDTIIQRLEVELIDLQQKITKVRAYQASTTGRSQITSLITAPDAQTNGATPHVTGMAVNSVFHDNPTKVINPFSHDNPLDEMERVNDVIPSNMKGKGA